MGSFIIIVVKLYSYIDSDVGNLRKFKYFHDYLRHLHKAWNLISFRPVMKVLFIYTCKVIFISNRWYWSWSVNECGSRGIARYDLLIEDLLVINVLEHFCLLLCFCWNCKNGLTAHSTIATTIDRASLLAQLQRKGRRQIGTRRRSGWGLMSHWR